MNKLLIDNDGDLIINTGYLKKNSNIINWDYLSKYHKLNEKFINVFGEYLNWKYLTKYQKLNEKLIIKFQKKINYSCYNWDNILKYQRLSENFIREFVNEKIREIVHVGHWEYITKFQRLSENFIIEFENNLNWSLISRYQRLSENFILKFQDKINWGLISQYQKLSYSFIEKYKKKIRNCRLKKNIHLDLETYIKLNKNYKIYDDEFINKIKKSKNTRKIYIYNKLNFLVNHKIKEFIDDSELINTLLF